MGHHARYIATHYRRGERPGYVAGVRLLERREDDFEDRDLVDREEILEMLDEGERIFTWDDDGEGLGGEIELVRVDGERFMRTDGEQLRADHLGDLPEI